MDHNNFYILETQTENEQCKCNVCDKIFASNSILHQHMEIHKREKPFKCTSCEYSFQSDTSLDEHMQIHNLVKPFQSIHISCSDPFVNNTALKENIVHAGERPYQCKICDK